MIILLYVSIALVIVSLAGLCVSYRAELRQPRSIQILLTGEEEGVIGVLVDGQPVPYGWNVSVSYDSPIETPSVAEELERSRLNDVHEVMGAHSGETAAKQVAVGGA